MRCALRPLLRPPRLRVALACPVRPPRPVLRCAASAHREAPRPRSEFAPAAARPPQGGCYRLAAPLLLAAAAYGLASAVDDEEEEEDDQDESEENEDDDDESSIGHSPEELDDDSPLEFRERYMRLKKAKRWVRGYFEHHRSHEVVEAFVPIVLDVQERVMDVASVSVADLADMYFYSGFFASVLADLPPDRLVATVDRISEGLSRFPERSQAARMMLVYTAMLTKEPALVKWFNDNAYERLNREPRYAGQPARIKKQISILHSELEQQLNENWAIIASGHFIATRNERLLGDIVEALDLLVRSSQGNVPVDAVQEALSRTCDEGAVAARAFARMDVSRRTPEVRDSIRQIVRAYGLKMRPPAKKKK